MFKKGLLVLVTVFVMLVGIYEVDAASISISSNKSSVIVGNTVTFTVTIIKVILFMVTFSIIFDMFGGYVNARKY